MRYCFFIITFLFLAFHGHSQTITSLEVYGDINSRVTADEIIMSDDGTSFTCIGHVTMEPFEPGEIKPCGGATGYICGTLAMQTTFGGITTFICNGSSGRCLQINAQ